MPRKVSLEAAVTRELKPYPPYIRLGAIGRSMVLLAQKIDGGALEPRDMAQLLRELRLASLNLREAAPRAKMGDEVDEVTAQREKRITGGQ